MSENACATRYESVVCGVCLITNHTKLRSDRLSTVVVSNESLHGGVVDYLKTLHNTTTGEYP